MRVGKDLLDGPVDPDVAAGAELDVEGELLAVPRQNGGVVLLLEAEVLHLLQRRKVVGYLNETRYVIF